MVQHNSGIGNITMVINGQRVSGCFGCLDNLTDEDVIEHMMRLAHRKLNQLEKELRAD